MPTTYNGIGTHYYGHRNAETRQATCRSCGRVANLTSYDTRLWFVVVFIPVIPLGRKRIIDQCALCRRHFVMEADKWETAKQLNVSGAMDKYEANPTPEAAMELHQTMLNFHQMTDAEKFRQAIAEKFPADAKVHAYLGEALAQIGNAAQAAPYFDRALELRPDLPEARVGVALQRISESKLDEARTLLDFLEKPGAAQLYPLAAMETLADAFQRAGRHEPALDLYQKLLAEFPHAGQIAGFRKKIAASEKALGRRGESILPKRKWSWKNFFGGGSPRPATASPGITWRNLAIVCGLVLLVIGGLAIGNEHVRRHRTVHLVNGFNPPAHVFIDHVGSVDVTNAAPREIVLKEGHYRARITGPVQEDVEFDVSADYFDRWSDHPVWLLNVGGSAVVLENRVTFSRNPAPAHTTVHFGRSFERLGGITHPFTVLPTTLQMKSSETRVLTNLELWREPVGGLIQQLVLLHREDEAMNLAEWQLARTSDDEDAVNDYAGAAMHANKIGRAAKFLEAGLTRRPVNIQWHRVYSSLARTPGLEERLTALYDQMLQTRANDSAVLYLRGRVETKPGGKSAWFERAMMADRANPYPYFASGSGWMSVPEWERARPLLAHAAELRPKDSQFADSFFLTRLALGEAPALETELRGKLKSGPPDFSAVSQMIDVLAAQDRQTEAKRIADEFERSMARFGPSGKSVQDVVHRHWLYASGNFREIAGHAAKDHSLQGRLALFAAQLELGDASAAARVFPLDQLGTLTPYHVLALDLAFRLAGDEAGAKEWETRAVTQLDLSDGDDLRAAALLRSTEPPSDAQLAALFPRPQDKALLCALLAAKHPTRRPDLSALARRLNVAMEFPHHLIVRATAAPR